MPETKQDNQETKQDPKQEMVSMPKEDYDKMNKTFAIVSERLEKLEKGGDKRNLEKPKYRTAKVWFLDPEMTKMVIKYGKSREVTQVDGSRILETEVTYLCNGKEHKQWIDQVKMRSEGTFVNAKIKELKKNDIIEDAGKTVVKEVKKDSYAMVETDMEVPNRVVTPNNSFVLELPNGIEVELGQGAVN